MKSRFFFIILSITAGILFNACKTMQKTNNQAHTNQIVFTLKKTACYGKCPVFTLNLFSDGTVMFEGKMFTEKIGLYQNHISEKEINNLIIEFMNADFFNLEDEYISGMTDLPTTYLTFTYNSKTKTIKDYYGSPEKLKILENTINRYRKLENWTRIEKVD